MCKNNFFSIKKCQRCGADLQDGRIMSMYNEQVICLECKALEQKRSDYAQAVSADHNEIKKGNYNFSGIGLNRGEK